MARQKIIQPPHPTLSSVSNPLMADDLTLKKLLTDLKDTLKAQKNPSGVGLSAPQINIAKRVFVAKVEDLEKDPKPVIFVDPEIVKQATQLTTIDESRKLLEGCLSLPGLYGIVQRSVWVEVTYLTMSWEKLREQAIIKLTDLEKVTIRYEGFAARVVLHEYDHLEGILFTQRVLEQGGTLYEVALTDEGEEELVEVELG